MDTSIAPASTKVVQLRYHVEGMDCPSCAGKIETALQRLGGAMGARVNYASQRLNVALDEAVTPRAVLESSVRALGFEISARQTSESSDPVTDDAPGPAAVRLSWWRARSMRLLLGVGTLLVLGLATGQLLPALGDWATLPAAALGLRSAGRRAFVLARSGSPFSIEMLMTVAAIGAVLIGAPAEAATVVFLFTAGEMLEGLAASRARVGIQALAALVPRTALLVGGGDVEGEEVRFVLAAAVRVGQVVLVRPGDRVPVDGTVVEGASELDQSPVTGESVPVAKAEGDSVLAGSVNGGAVLRIQATRPAADNTITRILHLVEEAQAGRSPTARFIERFSARYTPAVVAAAVLTALLPPLLGGAAWDTWIYRGLALLLIGCPCALVLSTPAAMAAALAAGTRRGLLIKGGAALEAIGHVRTIAFDKTGTLTRGTPAVTDVVAFNGTERTVLALAAAVENGSNHPLAKAILAHAAAERVPLRPARDARAIPGHGAIATVLGKAITVASPRFAGEQASYGGDVAGRVAALEADGKTVVLVLSEGEALGLIALRDQVRPDAGAGLAELHRLGLRVVMLTGDNRRAAEAIGHELGIESRAELLPDGKLREIATLREAGPVAMVGDGINDAPALAAATVGVAMGGGTDVALETADVALLGGRVADVAALVRLSRATLRNVHGNVAIALGLKAVFLVTTLAGLTGLWPAILADTGATVLVTANALRLLRHR